MAILRLRFQASHCYYWCVLFFRAYFPYKHLLSALVGGKVFVGGSHCLCYTYGSAGTTLDERSCSNCLPLTIAFAYCSKAQLRGASLEDETEDGKALVQKGVISKEELDIIVTQSGWESFYCIDAMRATVSEGLKVEDMENGWKMNAALAAMEETMSSLSDCIGGCLRVKSTGLPLAFDSILNTVGALFFTAACVVWAPNAGLFNPIIVLVAYIIAKMITRVGTDMEDPFGHDPSDLDLNLFCEKIYKQIIAVGERSKLVTYDLARGPALRSLPCSSISGSSDENSSDVANTV